MRMSTQEHLGYRDSAFGVNGCSGSAVVVKRISSGGRDTIGLHRASLKAETIQTLMFVKARLRLACRAIIDLIGDENDS